jgi:cyclase
MSVRIIPRLEIKGPNLVKGVHLEGLRVLGSPEQFARYYYEQGADELLYVDVVASLYQRNSLLDIVERTSRESFIPLAVGGGLRSIDDIRKALRAGADKVSLNTAAIRNPELIREAAIRFGSSTIVVSIEAKKRLDGTYEAYIDTGRERTGVDVLEWAQRVAELGAGEIILISIDREGTGKGFDLDLTRRIADLVPIPVIAGGGAGCMQDVGGVLEAGRADAVTLSSVLHYGFVEREKMASASAHASPSMGTSRGYHTSSRITGVSIPELKDYLIASGFDCRPTPLDAHRV